MTKFLSYITENVYNERGFPEQRTKSLSRDEALKILETKCSDAYSYLLKTKGVNYNLYRGLPPGNVSSYGFVQPSKFTRRSANAKGNHYTLYMDNDKKWKMFPKRSKSIICSTNKSSADAYGVMFYVVPFNGYKIGICSEDDVWHSFSNTFDYGLDMLTEILFNLGIRDSSYNDMIDDLDDMLMEDALESKKIEPWMKKALESVIKKYLITDETTMLDIMDFILSPIKNGFKITNKVSKLSSYDDNEVWTDSDCILINSKDIIWE